jgi:hypothetical protein
MTTLAELTASIEDFAETREASFISNIPLFIRAAEERILNTVTLPAQRRTSTRSIAANVQYVGLPADFISAFSLAIISGGITTYLSNKDASYIREAYPISAGTGVPVVYALFDDANLLIAPTTNAVYTMELNYFAKPESVVDNPTGTWLSINYSAALLYASLLNANVYIKGEADVQQMYEAMFTAHMMPIADVAKNKTRKDAYRSGQQRIEGGQ